MGRSDPNIAPGNQLPKGHCPVVIGIEERTNRSDLSCDMSMSNLVVMSVGPKRNEVEPGNHPVIKDVSAHSGNLDDDAFTSCAFLVAK
jgi:hypothetical protein